MNKFLLDPKTITNVADKTIAGKRKLMKLFPTMDSDDAFDASFSAALSNVSSNIPLSLRGRIKSAVGLNLALRRKNRGKQDAKTDYFLFQFSTSFDLKGKTITLVELGDQITFHYKFDDLGLYFAWVSGSANVSDRFQQEANLMAAHVLIHIQHNELVRVKAKTAEYITLILEGEHEVTFFCTNLELRFSFFKPKKTETKYVSAMVFKLAWECAEKHFGMGDNIGPLFQAK